MGRENSHGKKELFNLPHLVLKAGHLSNSTIGKGFQGGCLHEQALGGMSLGLRLVRNLKTIFMYVLILVH